MSGAIRHFQYIPSGRGHGFDIWQGLRIVKLVTKPRMWTLSMFRHNSVDLYMS